MTAAAGTSDLIDLYYEPNIRQHYNIKLEEYPDQVLAGRHHLDYVRSNGKVESKCIDLLNLFKNTNVDELIT